MDKLHIMLVCSAGMSTSILITKMRRAAEEKKVNADIYAISVAEAEINLSDFDIDVLLLGPQIRFKLEQLRKQVKSRKIPVEVISLSDYGTMNGENILNTALELVRTN